jgi:hypothetical protein
MATEDLKEFLKEIGNPSIEEVHSELADTLKYLSDNYGEIALNTEGRSVCMVNNHHILQALNSLTMAVTWLKVNKVNFRRN